MSKKVEDEQKARQNRFPHDRIAFYSSEGTAARDACIFQKYKERSISLGMAISSIASNNYLQNITEEQFMNELKLCGYTTPVMQNIEQDIREYAKKHKEVEE